MVWLEVSVLCPLCLVSQKQSGKRQRGIVLSVHGRQRLRKAIRQVETAENQGQRYTAKELSQRVDISEATMSRIWSGKSGIDRRSLQDLFNALGLTLTDADYESPNKSVLESPSETAFLGQFIPQPKLNGVRYPSGPVALDSPFYILRPPIEEQACTEIAQPGGIVRIKGPAGFGKSSLVLRVVGYAQQSNYAIASLDLKQADPEILADSRAFLRWFCRVLCLKLGQPANLDDCWDDILGNTLSTALFVQKHILEPSSRPVLLNMQEVNQLFAYPATAQAFFPLLRSWHEEAHHDPVWQRLRQVISYATDSYLPLDINQSPFNVGLPLLLPEFTVEQVDQLAKRYELVLSEPERDRLFALVGGNPTLVNLAFYHLTQAELSFEELIHTAAFTQGIFHPYLQRLLIQVQDGPTQMAQIKALVMSQEPIQLDPVLAYQLEAAGLVCLTPTGWIMRLVLYRDYLRHTLFEEDA